jgi:outer membrane protein
MRPKHRSLVTPAPSNRKRTALIAIAMSFLACHTIAFGAQRPLWEFGLGAGTVAFPDYRGSDTTHVYPLPVPYFVYRGDIIQADRDGVRGRLFHRVGVELSMSLNATTPVFSKHDPARRDMPDLKSTVEMGPSLDFHLWRSADRRWKLDWQLPIRAAFTVEASPRYIGWAFTPHLNLDVFDVAGGWNLGLLTGPIFADRKNHEYFYAVAPAYATADRPAYAAQAGYSGTQFLAAVSKRFPNYWVGAFVRYDALSGAAFAGSPLVRRQSAVFGGVGIAWIIGQSSRLVASED